MVLYICVVYCCCWKMHWARLGPSQSICAEDRNHRKSMRTKLKKNISNTECVCYVLIVSVMYVHMARAARRLYRGCIYCFIVLNVMWSNTIFSYGFSCYHLDFKMILKLDFTFFPLFFTSSSFDSAVLSSVLRNEQCSSRSGRCVIIPNCCMGIAFRNWKWRKHDGQLGSMFE